MIDVLLQYSLGPRTLTDLTMAGCYRQDTQTLIAPRCLHSVHTALKSSVTLLLIKAHGSARAQRREKNFTLSSAVTN